MRGKVHVEFKIQPWLKEIKQSYESQIIKSQMNWRFLALVNLAQVKLSTPTKFHENKKKVRQNFFLSFFVELLSF